MLELAFAFPARADVAPGLGYLIKRHQATTGRRYLSYEASYAQHGCAGGLEWRQATNATRGAAGVAIDYCMR